MTVFGNRVLERGPFDVVLEQGAGDVFRYKNDIVYWLV